MTNLTAQATEQVNQDAAEAKKEAEQTTACDCPVCNAPQPLISVGNVIDFHQRQPENFGELVSLVDRYRKTKPFQDKKMTLMTLLGDLARNEQTFYPGTEEQADALKDERMAITSLIVGNALALLIESLSSYESFEGEECADQILERVGEALGYEIADAVKEEVANSLSRLGFEKA